MLVKEGKKDDRYYQKKDEGKSLLVNKFLKQLRTHLKSRVDAIRGSDTHTHTNKHTLHHNIDINID